MATEKQTAANRLNAQHCTGPKTPEGKAISSQNALKTGIDAKSDVTRLESREAYEALIAAVYARYQPTEEGERFLVDDLIRTEWLSRRYMHAAAAIWECAQYIPPAAPGTVIVEQCLDITRIQRCISANKRDALAILKRLESLQAQKAARPAVEAEATAPEPQNQAPDQAEKETLTPQLVSFLTNPESAFNGLGNPPNPAGPDPETTAIDQDKEAIPSIAA